MLQRRSPRRIQPDHGLMTSLPLTMLRISSVLRVSVTAAAILAGAGEPGRARAPNENIEAATQQAKIEAIFDI